MSAFYDVEIYDENEFKERFPVVHDAMMEKIRKKGGDIEDYDFSQFSQFDVSNNTFFLSYVDKEDDDFTLTLEGDVTEPHKGVFEVSEY